MPFGFFRFIKFIKPAKRAAEINPDAEEGAELTGSFDEKAARLKAAFSDVDTFKERACVLGEGDSPRVSLFFMEGLADAKIIDDYILKPLTHCPAVPARALEFLRERVLAVNGAEETADLQKIVKNLCYGDTLLLLEGAESALLLDTKGFETRSVAEPDGEQIISGPREGFSEALVKNLGLLRRKLRTNDLKMKYLSLGRRTNTAVCVAYLGGVVNKGVLAELLARLRRIDIDGVLDANYISELIRDHRYSVFRTTGYTERPDVVAAKLLEGRVAIFTDGTPVVLTVPYLFIENFQSNEDYYLSFYYTSFSRLLRIAGFFLTVTVPALYIAIVNFHREMLPTNLMINVAIDSHNVPLPAALEALLLLVMFDILRETGMRMPSRVGQALSIVGALVVGQAAVEAQLVAAPMIIVVAVSGITNLLIPKLNAAMIYLRIALLLAAASLGFYGLILGLSVLMIHILGLTSFGVSQLNREESPGAQTFKDTWIRAPWNAMLRRPAQIANDAVRQKRPE